MNIKPAIKDIKAGIDFVKRMEIYPLVSNEKFNNELESYLYKKDKKGNLFDNPLKKMII